MVRLIPWRRGRLGSARKRVLSWGRGCNTLRVIPASEGAIFVRARVRRRFSSLGGLIVDGSGNEFGSTR